MPGTGKGSWGVQGREAVNARGVRRGPPGSTGGGKPDSESTGGACRAHSQDSWCKLRTCLSSGEGPPRTWNSGAIFPDGAGIRREHRRATGFVPRSATQRG